jgi:hypothetical protein
MPYKPEIFKQKPIAIPYIELDPVRAMQKETEELYDQSAVATHILIDMFPLDKSPVGTEGMKVFDKPVDLDIFPSEIAPFLQYEIHRCQDPVIGLRAMEQNKSRTLQLFVSERDGVYDDEDKRNTRSYVSIVFSPGSVLMGAWSAEDPISPEAHRLVRAIRECISRETKAERDVANYNLASATLESIEAIIWY